MVGEILFPISMVFCIVVLMWSIARLRRDIARLRRDIDMLWQATDRTTHTIEGIILSIGILNKTSSREEFDKWAAKSGGMCD